jgi:hypothetical protein
MYTGESTGKLQPIQMLQPFSGMQSAQSISLHDILTLKTNLFNVVLPSPS